MKKLYILLFTLLIAGSSFAQTTVFINEIHYDNATGTVGGDIDEGIEIAGPAGTDLTNWTIAKYNGNGGTVYGTENLSGTIPDQGNGYGTLWFGVPQNGLQNGSPDGMALVAADGTTVIQFLSYEGTIIASGGPADTMTSTDIGVSEPGTTPDGESLQLVGSGTTYESFIWSGPIVHTRGAVNTGQTFGAAVPSVNLGVDIINLDYFEGFGPSSEGSFSVIGANLTDNISISVPNTNFELSLTSGGTFGSSVVVTQSGGTASGTVFVRLSSGLSAGPYTVDATASSPGATDDTVNLSGTVSPADPQITVTAFLDPLNYSAGSGPSAVDSFTVEGLFLTSDIVVTSPSAAFELSLMSGGTFTGSVNVPFGSGTVMATDVFVRLASSLPEGPYSGDITVSSTGVTDELVAVTGNVFGPPTNNLVLTGAYDGPLTGGIPKGIELYVIGDIPDLSKFGVSSITNGGGSSAGNIEYTFPADAVSAGTHIWLATESPQFTAFFGFAPTYTNGVVGINGDDAIELYENGVIIDTFGDVDMDGSGEPWDYLDGWAYRLNNTGPDGGFVLANWYFSGANALDGETSNSTAATPFPISSYPSFLSVNEVDSNSFNVFPNPTNTGYVNISSLNSEVLNAKVFDVLGKQVLEGKVENNQLNVSNLNAGLYILKLSQNNATVTKKLIIQ